MLHYVLSSLDHILIIFCSVHQGTLQSMSLRFLRALQMDRRVLHTPVDDLESFLWVLVWSLVHILISMKKDNNEGLQEDNEEDLQLRMILTVLSSRYIPDVTDRETLVADGWPDMVFGGLILEWLEIAKDSRRLVMRPQTAFLRSSDNDARERNLDHIEDCGSETYKKFFQAGYKHLQNIREFSDWEAVVNFTGEPL